MSDVYDLTELTARFDWSLCRLVDAVRLRRLFRQLHEEKSAERKSALLQKLQQQYDQAKEILAKRLDLNPFIHYPEGLPVSVRAQEIAAALREHTVVIVAGETGSGKTTQLPKICLDAGFGRKGMIGHTQPRRIAASAVAKRIAEELQVNLGEAVGYQVRFNEQVSEQSLIKVMTDGILLAELKNDPFLNRYEVLIIDEAHERSLNIDFILGYLCQLLTKRPDLKVIITSATIDVERFSKHFGSAPIIEVSGRSYPVDLLYQAPLGSDDEDDGDDTLPNRIHDALDLLIREERERGWRMGDVLVFLPGEREIREVSKYLRHVDLRDTEVLPLYSRLSTEEQNRIFHPHKGRRIVLATNVAETSLTVPGIRYVIDSGQARISRYSYRSKMQRLPIEAISQASANQRAGRCGRVAEGICVRLYAEADVIARPAFTEPEILRTNLASVILKMLDVGLGDVTRFPFIDPPDNRLWNDGYKLLFELGAVDAKRKLTPLGRKLADLPIDPKLARILIEASERNCLSEVLVMVSALSIQDPRERPAEYQQAADQAHAQDKDPDSDFVALWNLWQRYETERQNLSNNQLKKFCQKNFLSPLRMREWRELHRQLAVLLKAQKHGFNTSPANYDSIHQSLLSGFLGNLARHDEKREYDGCRNRRIQLSPGTGLAKKSPKWIVSADIVETQKIYARCNARIEPEWAELLAVHLVKKSYSEPHWEKKRAQVCAYEKQTLYGLDIVAKRVVNYGQIDPTLSREILIRSALVEGEFTSTNPALKHNRALLEELEELENRTRRRDLVVDDETVFQLYDAVIPAHVVSGASFDKWYRHANEAERQALHFRREQFQRVDATDDAALFPDYLEQNGIRFPLHYRFDPAAQDDGITLSVPLRALKQLNSERLEKLVPGLLREKCVQLIKHLPRTLRKHFVPVPDMVDSVLPEVESSDRSLLEALGAALKKRTGVTISYEAWNVEALDNFLKFNIQVLDAQGRVVQSGRNYAELTTALEARIDSEAAPVPQVRDGHEYQTWDFPDLPDSVLEREAGIEMRLYPALQDCKTGVRHQRCHDPEQARVLTDQAQARLLSFRLSEQIGLFAKQLPHYRELALLYAPVGLAKDFYDDFTLGCIKAHFLDDSGEAVIRSRAAFEACYQALRGDFVAFAREYSAVVFQILTRHHELMKRTKGKVALDTALALSDLQHQLAQLVRPGFLSSTRWKNLQDFPRYLEAALQRLDKMARSMNLERQYVAQQRDWWQQYSSRKQQLEAQGIYDPELDHFRWLMEELRVSWYAQQLGTSEPVSEKRLNKQWERVRRG